MDHAICLMSVVPVRALPNDRSEQVTQLLFGELVTILKKEDRWVLVQIQSDSYQGWVSAGQLRVIDEPDFLELTQQPHFVNTDLVQVLKNNTRNTSLLVTAGSTFYNCNGNRFNLLGESWEYFGTITQNNIYAPDSIAAAAMLFLHSPYQWGGKSALGIDCSGLTQVVFRMCGRQIHRDASQQATQGEMVQLINEAMPGDLVFFDNEEGNIIHVGILLDNMNIIHAHQKVRVDKIDHMGIFNVDLKKYTHKLRVIKRI